MNIKIDEHENKYSREGFWGIDGISGLYSLFQKDIFLDIFPKIMMTRDQKLNAISRLIIYVGFLLSFYYSSSQFLLLTIIGLILIYLYHSLQKHKISINKQDINKYKSQNTVNEPLTINYKGYKRYKTRPREFIKPSKNNPFMNVLPDSYQTKPNCISQIDDSNINYDELQQTINNKFNDGLYHDISDIYGKASSQRQFYTMPNTSIPNDQEGFAEWLYQTSSTCKEGNSLACETKIPPRLIGNLSQAC